MPLDRAEPRRSWGRTIAPGDLRHDANIFTILRCLLASAVIFSHAFDVTGHYGLGDDPSRLVLPFPVSRLSVLLFFTLSGFLVTGSLVKRGVRDFALARALRLVPGLWMMLAVTTVVLGAAFNAGSFAALLQSPSLHRYLVNNAFLIGRNYSVDALFAANPLPALVNGSLWTIPQEVRCYIVLGLLGAIGLLGSRRALTIGYVAFVAIDLLVPPDAVHVLANARGLAVSFFFGVVLYLWRERVFLAWPLAAAAVAGGLILPDGPLRETGTALAFGYAALVAAFLVPAALKRISAAVPDYSYGIYVYAFPAQQAAFALGLGTTPYANMAAGFALALPFAAASWHFVEKPALGLKPRLTRPSQAAAVSATAR